MNKRSQDLEDRSVDAFQTRTEAQSTQLNVRLSGRDRELWENLLESVNEGRSGAMVNTSDLLKEAIRLRAFFAWQKIRGNRVWTEYQGHEEEVDKLLGLYNTKAR